MKVNVLFLDYERHQFTEEVKRKNFGNAGYEFDHVIIDMKGIAAAINSGIKESFRHDAIVTMANDILMPDNWLLKMVEAWQTIPNTGMAGIHCVERPGNEKEINGLIVQTCYTAFGNVLIPMEAVKKIGYFNEDYDPYGMQDADYAFRLNNTGHINYYLHKMKSEHLGHDVGQPSDYRRMKDEGLSKAQAVWNDSTKKYSETNDYTIFLNEWEETK